MKTWVFVGQMDAAPGAALTPDPPPPPQMSKKPRASYSAPSRAAENRLHTGTDLSMRTAQPGASERRLWKRAGARAAPFSAGPV